jgi:hypothetical protein
MSSFHRLYSEGAISMQQAGIFILASKPQYLNIPAILFSK